MSEFFYIAAAADYLDDIVCMLLNHITDSQLSDLASKYHQYFGNSLLFLRAACGFYQKAGYLHGRNKELSKNIVSLLKEVYLK